MNILVVSGFWPVESNTISGIFVVQQVAALVRCGYLVTVIVTRAIGRPFSPYCRPAVLGLDSGAVKLVVLPLFRIPEKLSSIPGAFWLNTAMVKLGLVRAIKNILSVQGIIFDGCIVHEARYMGVALPSWRRYVDGRVILVIHGFDPFLKRSTNRVRTRPFFRAAAQVCDVVVLVGRSLQEYAVSIGLPAEKLLVLANGSELPDTENLLDYQHSPGEPRRIVSVSNLVDWKGIDDNLRALAHIRQSRPDLDWEYRVVGDGVERQRLVALAEQLGIAERVRFLGRISYGETMHEIAMADIFSLPSWGEAFGIVYLEAMSRMCPVIGCLANGAEDIVTDEHDGLLVPPRDVTALTIALARLIESPELSQYLGQNARTTAKGYSWDHNARRMLDLMEIKIEVQR